MPPATTAKAPLPPTATHAWKLRAAGGVPEMDGWRHVACQTFERGDFQEVEAFKVGPMRSVINHNRERDSLAQ